MGEFAIGQGVSRFEDPRLIRGGGRYTDDVKLPGWPMAWCCARRTRTPRSIDRHPAAKAAPGVLCVLTSADIKAAGSRSAGARRAQAARRSPIYKPRYPILAEDHVRWVGDYVAFVVAETSPGDRRRRTDRGRLRGAARGDVDRRGAEARQPAGVGGLSGQHLFVELVGDKAATDAAFAAPRMWSSIASSSTASPPHPWSRAARSATTTPPTAATPSIPRSSGRIPSAPSSPRSSSIRKQRPYRYRRHRRQLRNEIAGI